MKAIENKKKKHRKRVSGLQLKIHSLKDILSKNIRRESEIHNTEEIQKKKSIKHHSHINRLEKINKKKPLGVLQKILRKVTSVMILILAARKESSTKTT